MSSSFVKFHFQKIEFLKQKYSQWRIFSNNNTKYMHFSLLFNDVENVACDEDCMILIRYFDHDCEKNSQSSFELFEKIARKWSKNNKLLIVYFTISIYHIRSKIFKNFHYLNELIDFTNFSSIKILKNFANCDNFVIFWDRKIFKYRITMINLENRFNFTIQ